MPRRPASQRPGARARERRILIWLLVALACFGIGVARGYYMDTVRTNRRYMVDGIRVDDPGYIHHTDISKQYRRDLEAAPSFLRRSATQIRIGHRGEYENSYTIGSVVYLTSDNYEKDMVRHELIHTFDNKNGYSGTMEFREALMADGYPEKARICETYVDVMSLYLDHPYALKNSCPHLYACIKQQVGGGGEFSYV